MGESSNLLPYLAAPRNSSTLYGSYGSPEVREPKARHFPSDTGMTRSRMLDRPSEHPLTMVLKMKPRRGIGETLLS